MGAAWKVWFGLFLAILLVAPATVESYLVFLLALAATHIIMVCPPSLSVLSSWPDCHPVWVAAECHLGEHPPGLGVDDGEPRLA
ncbi:MAG: hypothetical protein ACREJ4_09955, partial [Candidatus Methylomirabilaceae bacterium]